MTIKVIELVLIKQDTWSRGERVNAPAGCSLTSCIHMHYSAHSTAVQSLNRLVYTSKTGKKKKVCNKEIQQLNPTLSSVGVGAVALQSGS